jgi:hypothetical protein
MPSVNDTTQQVNETFPQQNFTPKPASPLKTILLIVLGLIFVSAIAFAGYWYGKRGVALPWQETPAQPGKSSNPSKVEWKTFSDKDLKFSFSYMTQYLNQSIKVRDASWGRHMDEDIPSFYGLTGASYRIKVSPATSRSTVYGQKADGDIVWKEAVDHIKGFTIGAVADSALMKAVVFPYYSESGNYTGNIVSSRSGELGVETWFVDVPSGTLVHKVVFMVNPEVVYEFQTNYTLLGTSIKWEELEASIINGTADGQYLLGYENFMLAVSTFKFLDSPSTGTVPVYKSTDGWVNYGIPLSEASFKYPSDWKIKMQVSSGWDYVTSPDGKYRFFVNKAPVGGVSGAQTSKMPCQNQYYIYDIVVDDTNAVYCASEDSDELSFTFIYPEGSDQIEITSAGFTLYPVSEKNAAIKLFEQVLSTFRFNE